MLKRLVTQNIDRHALSQRARNRGIHRGLNEGGTFTKIGVIDGRGDLKRAARRTRSTNGGDEDDETE